MSKLLLFPFRVAGILFTLASSAFSLVCWIALFLIVMIGCLALALVPFMMLVG